ncbi:MAG: right-handed parallel beta-helix repeat-containing protein [Anaerolineae bacterium]|nr:right-handed parallel beta-helix repeat-containing protein [Anaerolineae bacterium]
MKTNQTPPAVSASTPLNHVWTRVQRAVIIPLVALGLFAGLLVLLNQPLTLAAAATLPTAAPANQEPAATTAALLPDHILYVTANGSGTECSIAQPCQIQTAVNVATAGDEIRVAAGLYNDVMGNGVFTQTVAINKSLTLRGGYTSSNWLLDPDPIANETILDGDNEGRVIYISGPTVVTVEGFIIRNGFASNFGAGVYKANSGQAATFRNNIFHNNIVTGTPGIGGAIYTVGPDQILNNSFYNNFSIANGGAIALDNSNQPRLQNNLIYNNVTGDSATALGGGVYVLSGSALLDGNIIYGNLAGFGGGFGSAPGTEVILDNNIFYSNQSRSGGAGGGILIGGVAQIRHNTIVDNNSPTTGGGGIYVAGGTVLITNTIVASNTAPTANNGIFVSSGTASGSTNNIFNNGHNGSLSGTITSNPRFANYAGDDFHLSANSTDLLNAALDIGLTHDVDGQVRPFGAGPDVGADEFYDPSVTCFARVNDGPVLINLQDAINSVTQASDIVKVAGRCTDTDNEVALINQSLTLRGGYTTTDWLNQSYGPTLIDAQGVSGRRGIHITGGSPTLDALHITGGNLPSSNGSAVYISGGSGANLHNLVLFGNNTGGTNGALGVANGVNATIEFNTLVNNTGWGVHFEGTGAIHNSILYLNSGGAISGGAGHSFNLINVDPLFVNAAANDYHLTAASPAIGAANPNATLSRDFEGDTRPRGNHFDAGADEANQYPAVLFTPDYTDEVDRGTVVTINHTLTNLGTQADTFSLVGSTSLGWDYSYPTTPFPLNPGQSVQVTVVITVPAGASPQQVGVTTITATSALNAFVYDTVVDTITVAQIPGVQFTPSYSNALLPGESIIYTHLLTNTGDYTDTFTVDLISDPFGWGELLPDDPFNVILASGQVTPVVLVVTVPEYAAAGFANTMIIRAHSNYAPSVSATVTDTVTAKPTVGTRYVSNAGFDFNNNCTQVATPCRTVKQAVTQASFGDEIHIAAGNYGEADITVNDTMHLSGGWTNDFTAQVIDPALTMINGAQMARIFTIAGGTQPTFFNLTMQNGLSSAAGGGVLVGNGAQPTFTLVHFLGNQSGQGGAIFAEANSHVRLIESRLHNNVATRNGGGLFMVSGSSLVSATTFVGNSAGGNLPLEGGGAIYQQGGTLSMINSLMANNISARHGGAMFGRGGAAQIEFTTLVGNAAAGSGALYNDGAVITINNSILANNSGVTGGALFGNSGTLNNNYDLFWNNLPNNGNVTLGANSVFGDPDFADGAYRISPNSAAVDSADPASTLAVDFEGDPRPADSGFDIGYDELAGCLAKRGTIIYASIQDAINAGTGGDLIQVSGICRGVHGVDIGGGVIVSQTVFLEEPLTIQGGWNSDFTSNDPVLPTYVDPQGQGRALYLTGNVTSTIESLILLNGNAIGLGGGPSGEAAGGGIYINSNNTQFVDLTVISGTAQLGGGIYVAGSVISMTDGTILGNTATVGAGVYHNGFSFRVNNSALINNVASGNGGGFYQASGFVEGLNVILAGNSAAAGGGYYHNSGTANLYHLTVYGNAAAGNGGGIYQNGGSSIIRSAIFENNSGNSGPAIFVAAGAANVDYNYYYNFASTPVVGVAAGANSVITNDTPPGLTNPAGLDFHLVDGAAAVDIADPNSPVVFDFDMDPRPSNQGFDMGADEVAGCYARVNDVIYGSIQRAIEMADPGDQIDVAGRCIGTHTFNAGGSLGVISTTVHITKNVILMGGWDLDFASQDEITIIDPLQRGYAIYVAPGITATVQNFHLIHGNGNAPGMSGNGGAIYINNALPQIMGNSIYSNTAINGSAIYINNAAATIGGGNRIHHNSATNGSIYVSNSGQTATIANNFFYDNQATNGAGVYHGTGAANVWHNNFISNNAVGAGGGVYVAAASPNIRNNIFTGNTSPLSGGIRCNTGATPVINYNDYFNNSSGDVGGAACTAGANSLFVDPLFVNPAVGNYDLQNNSPLIDAGDPTMTLLVDYEDRIRPSHQGWDIGAYELGGCYAQNQTTPDIIFGSLQRAVNLASNGDVILVDGTCLGVNTRLVSGNPTTQNLFVDKRVTIDGNWNAGFPDSNDDPAVLQPQEQGRVVYIASGHTVTLTNMILTNGNGNVAGLSGHGGGIYNTGTLILNNTFIELSLGVNGAGIYNIGPLTVDSSTIRQNTATNGGGIYNNFAGTTVITATEITLNIATVSGAGVYQQLGTLQVEANLIHANVASVSGGGIFQNAATLRLLRNEVYSNTTSGSGGGVYLNAASGANQVYNNFIYRNQAVTGGGLYNNNSNTGIWHNTFVANTASSNNGGGLFSAANSPVIRNNIVHNNSGSGIHATGGSPNIGYNNVVGNSGGGYGGIASDSGGGIAAAPIYVDAPAFNYRLQYGSPGIDVGDPVSPVVVDIDGDTRPNNDQFDMGADELNACLIRVGTALFTHLQDAINYAEANNIYTVEIARGICRGVRPDPVSGITLQVGYVRENLNFIGSLNRNDFSDPNDHGELGFNTTAIDAENQGRVVVIAPTAVVSFTHVALVRGNAFAANDSNSNGGGLYNPQGHLYSHEINICQSQAADGGGYYGGATSSANLGGGVTGVCGVGVVNEEGEVIDILLFTGNNATNNGGGLYTQGSLIIRNLGLYGNAAANHGGGLYNSAAAARLTNFILYTNFAGVNGGGLYNTGSDLELLHNTIRNNNATNDGGGVFNSGANLLINSTILYNNSAGNNGGGLSSTGGTLAYNNFNSNTPNDSTIGLGTNVYTGTPQFIPDTVYRIQYTSGNIDKADPALISPPYNVIIDADLDSRPDNLPPHNGLWEYRSDIGADEFAKEFSCIIEPESRTLTGAAGSVVIHNFTLRNDGNFTDTITITLQSSSMGWATLVGGPQTYLLDPDETRAIVLEVAIPITATTDMVDISILQCQSLSIPDNTATATATTQVALLRGLLVDPDYTAFALPGDVLTFTHIITNVGNQTENVQIIPNSGPQFANASLYNPDGTPFFPDTISMDAGEAITLLLRVAIFEDAMGGGIATPGVIARLVADPTIFDASQNIINIGYVPGTRFLAATGSVDNSNCTNPNNPCATLQHALNQAMDGDAILLSVGTYTDYTTRTIGSVTLVQNGFVEKDVSISGGYNAADGYTSFQPITNTVILDGAGHRVFYITADATVTLTALFMDNGRHPLYGGGIYNAGGNLSILGSWLRNNVAHYGGALFQEDGTLFINSSVIADSRAVNNTNTLPGEGAGLHIVDGSVRLENNTFVNNRNETASLAPAPTGNGGALFQAAGEITLLNNIFAFNVTQGVGAAYYLSPTVTWAEDYTLFYQNGLAPTNVPTGSNSFTANPLFADTLYHLSDLSPAIDAGTIAVFLGLDMDGESRLQGIAVDIGADEYTQVAEFVFVPPFQSALIEAGSRYTYTHTLTNTGDFADSYTLIMGHSTTGGTGWDYTLSPTNTGMLNPGEGIQVTMVITGGPPGYVDTTVITATSAASSLSLAVTDQTTISQTAGVDIEPSRFGSGVAGGTVIYTHTVTNTGDGPDSFTVTVAAATPDGWDIDITPANTGVLLPNDATIVTVTIQIPLTVTVTVHTLVVEAASVVNPAVTDQVEDITTIYNSGALLEPDYFTVVEPGTVLTYVHTLTNIGNISDTFTLDVTSSQGWFVSIDPAGPIDLDVSESVQITVVVAVPLTATPGQQDDTIITATSDFNPAMSDTATDITRVAQDHGLTFTPSQTRTVPANTVQVYTHTLTNTGNGPDTFAITAVSSEGWDVQTPANITLNPGNSATVAVTLTVPAVPPITDTMRVTATSVISPAFYATVTNTTIVTVSTAAAGVEIAPDRTGSGTAGTIVTYQHTVTNTGNIADSFTLSLLSSQGWTVDVSPASVTLNAGETALVTVTVTIPGAAAVGTVDVTTVTATSTFDPTVTDTATDTTTVIESGTAGVIIAPDNTNNGTAGTTLTYQHTVTNTGLTADTINLTVLSNQGWTVAVNPTTVSLAAGLSSPVVVTVTIPGAAAAGTIDVTTVTATSTNDPSVSDTATDTTLVLAAGAGVMIAPDNTGFGDPGTDILYTHWVTNTGSTADSFLLNPQSTEGWDVGLSQNFISLNPGERVQITVTVSIPAAATLGTVDVTTISATSTNDPTVLDSATDTTTVGDGPPPEGNRVFLPVMYTSCTPITGVDLVVVGIEIVPANPTAGQTVTVRVTIRNQGTTNVTPGNNFYLDFYVNRSPAPVLPGDIQWGIQGSWMTAGATRTLTDSYVFSGGTHQLWAQVDTDNTVNECPNEHNNILGPITLTVTGTAGQPAGDVTPVAPAPLDRPRPTPTPGLPDDQENSQIEGPIDTASEGEGEEGLPVEPGDG